MPVQSQKILLKVSDGTEVQCYVSKPAELSPSVGLIVFQEAFGVNHHMRSVTDRFAEHGYLAICPELFHRTAPVGLELAYDNFQAVMPYYQALTDAGLEADGKACFDWLTGQGAKNIGCVGFCLGGRVSFLTNSSLPYKAAVSYYGGGIAPALLPKAKDQKAPVLFHWGGLDKHITPEIVKSVEEAMKTTGKNYISAVYSQADHAFSCDDRPNYNAEAAELAWVSTIAFLKLHLSKV